MFALLIQRLTHHWRLVVVFWVAAVALTIWLAPRWNDVTYDGDLAYMPPSMTSSVPVMKLESSLARKRIG